VRFHPSRRDESREPGHVRWKVTNGRPDLAIALYVGRLAPEKTLDVLPELMDLLNGPNNEHPTVQLVIVGDGPCRPETEAVLKGKLVTFMGHMPQAEELWTLYASADMFFSPSTTEAFALVFLEAMASGLPVCGPDAGGIPEAFTEGREGFLYRPIFDATDAARAVRDTLAANAKPRDGSHPHIRDLARLHAESLSWDETYRQASVAYMRAWRAVVGPAPIDAASSSSTTGSLEKSAAGCSTADSNAVLLSGTQQAAQ
jgi:glycosyltransferase involved in cell wall biosynthesis